MVRRHSGGPRRSAGWTGVTVLLSVAGAIVLAGSPAEATSARYGLGSGPSRPAATQAPAPATELSLIHI